MSRTAILLSCLVLFCQAGFAQKPVIDTSAINDWTEVDRGELCPSACYGMYMLIGHGSVVKERVLFQSEGKRKLVFYGDGQFKFTADSRYAIITRGADSLSIIRLPTFTVESLKNIKSWIVFNNGTDCWLAYQSSANAHVLLRNINTGKTRDLGPAISFFADPVGRWVFLQQRSTPISNNLLAINSSDGQMLKVFEGDQIQGHTFDHSGGQLAFTTVKANGQHKLWYWRKEDNRAIAVDSDKSENGIGVTIDHGCGEFVANDCVLLYSVTQVAKSPVKAGASVEVWDYKMADDELPGAHHRNKNTRYWAFIPVSKKIVHLPTDDNDFIARPGYLSNNILVAKNQGYPYKDKNLWYPRAEFNFDILDLTTGSRKPLPVPEGFQPDFCHLSPGGRYVVYFDPGDHNYFSYEVATGKRTNISQPVKTVWTRDERYEHPGWPPFLTYGIAGWLQNDAALLIYDRNNIWMIDPSGGNMPVCLTSDSANSAEISFRIGDGFPGDIVYKRNEPLLLTVFDHGNKQNGFARVRLGKRPHLELLRMWDQLVNEPQTFGWQNADGRDAVVSLDGKGFLIRAGDAAQAPNYLFTRDFKRFNKISDNHPEKRYNWLTTELVRWTSLDGHPAQGVLYKPENFDSQKKYPLIVYCYESFSDELHRFFAPDLSAGAIDIPSFVSRGYLVFCPDIHYDSRGTGASCYNYVESAVRHLQTLPCVDSGHIGLQGHSMGGFEVDYLVSHSHRFTAALSASGISDAISDYDDVDDVGSRQDQYELGQLGLFYPLWQDRQRYLDNSAVLHADSVTVPLLLMNNKDDTRVHFHQGQEFFLALRRLHKTVWMLQYDGEGHVIDDPKNRLDFTIKLFQFFDHYLKGAPAPAWMTMRNDTTKF